MGKRFTCGTIREGEVVPMLSFRKALVKALKAGPATAEQLLARMKAAGVRSAYPLTTAKALVRRLGAYGRRSVVAQLLVGGRNVFVPAEALQEAAKRFDLADPTARLVAADWLEEQGQGEVAGLLRRAKRFTFGD